MNIISNQGEANQAAYCITRLPDWPSLKYSVAAAVLFCNKTVKYTFDKVTEVHFRYTKPFLLYEFV